MPEKLLTMQEACGVLGISIKDVKGLVARGDLPAYKIGGKFLRFRKEQIEAIKTEIAAKKTSEQSKMPPRKPILQTADVAYTQSPRDGMLDFLYFNDFYIICGIVASVILWIIFRG